MRFFLFVQTVEKETFSHFVQAERRHNAIAAGRTTNAGSGSLAGYLTCSAVGRPGIGSQENKNAFSSLPVSISTVHLFVT
jgi:hypothetical protein